MLEGDKSLSARTVAGLGWVIVWRTLSRVLGIGSTLALVRLLAPTDFGLVALALSVTQAVEVLSLMGVQEALVRLAEPTRDIYDTAFTLNLLRAAANAMVIAIVAWPIASFFGEPRLVPIILVTAGSIFLGGLENIGIIEFRRQLSFDREIVIRIMPRLIAIATTIAIAALYRTYWALVVGSLVNRVTGVIMTYVFHPHRPRLTLVAHRELLGFSLWVWIVSLVGMLRDRIEVFLVGRLFNLTSVGVFSVALEIATLPVSEILQPLSHVLFSTFSRASHDADELRRLFLRFYGLAAATTVPVGIGLALLADPIVHVLLGPAWLNAIPMIQAISALGAVTSFGLICRSVLEARGQMRAIFNVNVATTAIRLVAGLALVEWIGPLGAAFGYAIGAFFDQALLFHYTRQRLSVPLARLAGCLWRPVLASAAMVTAVIAIGLHLTPPDSNLPTIVVRMLAGVILGASVYMFILWTAWRISGKPDGAETDMLQALREALAKVGSK